MDIQGEQKKGFIFIISTAIVLLVCKCSRRGNFSSSTFWLLWGQIDEAPSSLQLTRGEAFLHWKSNCIALAVEHVSGREDLCRIGCIDSLIHWFVDLLILQETMGESTPKGIQSCLHHPREKNHHINQKHLPNNVMVDYCLTQKMWWVVGGWLVGSENVVDT